jgi:hypothetical protein
MFHLNLGVVRDQSARRDQSLKVQESKFGFKVSRYGEAKDWGLGFKVQGFCLKSSLKGIRKAKEQKLPTPIYCWLSNYPAAAAAADTLPNPIEKTKN